MEKDSVMAQDSHGTINIAKTILLAEDDATLREPLRRILERAGFSVLVAKDGQEALRIASEYPDRIDLLVADVRMPGMTGPDLATTLRHSRPDLRMLFISARPQRMLTLEKGWNVVHKPFTMQAFLDSVHEILRLRLSQAFRADHQGR
jgi:two-component system cell cycle sensor histidine kinase/response regulator CckA